MHFWSPFSAFIQMGLSERIAQSIVTKIEIFCYCRTEDRCRLQEKVTTYLFGGLLLLEKGKMLYK